MSRVGVYAYICMSCNHRLARHTAKPGEVFYICAFCPCAVPQDAPAHGLRKREFEDWIVRYPEPAITEGEKQ